MYLPDRQIVGSGTANTAQGATASAATGDMTASITSDPVDCKAVAIGCIHAVWTGTPTGTFTVEATGGDYSQDRPSTTTWENITATLTLAGTGNTLTPAGASGSLLVVIPNLGYRAVRLKYTRTSGGANNTLNAWFNGKSF